MLARAVNLTLPFVKKFKNTDNISKVIDEQLSPLSQMLQNFGKRANEAEEKIQGVEESFDQAHLPIQSLNKEMQSMAEHIDDLDSELSDCLKV